MSAAVVVTFSLACLLIALAAAFAIRGGLVAITAPLT